MSRETSEPVLRSLAAISVIAIGRSALRQAANQMRALIRSLDQHPIRGPRIASRALQHQPQLPAAPRQADRLPDGERGNRPQPFARSDGLQAGEVDPGGQPILRDIHPLNDGTQHCATLG